MSKIKYEVRKDGNPYIQVAESESELLETFMIIDDYPYIRKAMHEENYELKNLLCFVFDEILFENKVVGFATYDVRNNFELIMTECYILPEFRGKRLFFDEICKMHFAAPRFGILQPTRNVIELLLNYAFAKYVTDDIVVSAIDLYLDPIWIKSSKTDEFLHLQVPPSNFYDSSICSTLFVHDDEVFYHNLLDNDCLRGHRRKKLDKSYFDSIVDLFCEQHDELENLVVELKGELPDNKLGYDVIVGYGDGLSEYMQRMVDSDIISYEHAIAIRKQLIKEYDFGIIDDSNIEDRFNTLSISQEVVIKNFEELKELVDSDQLEEEVGFFKDLITIVGDNDELGNELFKALVSGNEVEFQRMISEHLENNPSFFEELIDWGDDYEIGYDEESIMEYTKEYLKDKFRLDEDNNSENYPDNHDWEIYTILHALDYGDNYYDALNGIFLESLASPELLTDYLSKSNFIKKDGIINVDWVENESDFPEPYLKQILYCNNLEIEGTKSELIERLSDNNVTLGDSYKITPKGKDYLKELSWIGFYDEFLYEFDFIDFWKYRSNHKGNIKELSLNYIDEHICIARKNHNENHLEYFLDYKKDILNEADEFLKDSSIPE